jgi:hypothetical protein
MMENIREKCVSDADMPIEEYRKRLKDAEHRAEKAERENLMLKECIVRMALGRYGVLND